jgi:glycosyltransferase involved in cell wall biosynthesis
VDLAHVREAADPGRLRQELGLDPATPLVAVVSRLTRLKGLENLLEAAAMLKTTHAEARFLIVGETSPMEVAYLGDLKQLAERLGVADRVIFTGRRSDVPALLGAVNVSVMPSLNEALSNVLLESMAAGAPTVATRVGGTPEALADGQTGLLVEPGDSRAIATAVGRLLDDPGLARRLGSAARKLINDEFSVERMVRSTEDLYTDLLARKHRSVPARKQSAVLQRSA